MLRTFSARFAVFISFLFFGDIITLNVNLYFERDETFKDLLPITGDVSYTETRYNLSQMECANRCVFCAGYLYNSGTGTCHLLETLLDETDFNRSRLDIGWELYKSVNVCSVGWHLYRTRCYTYVELKATWTEAKNYCASTGSHLVQIKTREENDWIKEKLNPALRNCVNNNCCDAWIGASDQEKEGEFQWTKKDYMAFTNWLTGEPNNYGGDEDCVARCINGKWNDFPCNYPLNIICEKDILFN